MGIYNLGGGGGAPVLEARTVTPSTSQQIIKPSRDEYDGLSQVTVEATPLETRTVNPSTSSQTITPSGSNIGFSTITVNPYRLQSKSVTPSTSSQTVSPDSGYNGLSSVSVGGVSLQSKTVSPSSLPSTITQDSGYVGLSSVTIQKPSSLIPENIVVGKSIFGVNGTFVGNYYCKKLSMYLNQNGFSVNLPELSSNISDVLFCVCYSTNGMVVWSGAQIMVLMQTYPIEGYAPEVIYDPSRGSVYLMVDGGTQLLNSISGNTITFTLTSTSPGGRTFRTDILYTVLLGVSL